MTERVSSEYIKSNTQRAEMYRLIYSKKGDGGQYQLGK